MSNRNYCSMDEQPKMYCIHCKETKPTSLFKPNKHMASGRMRFCYKCHNNKYRKPKAKRDPIKYLPGEIWRFVSEMHNEYKISNKGRLMSINYNREGIAVILSLPLMNGYHRVHLQGKNWFIHRLVAIYFMPNPENKPHVNHINGIKNDNRVENLEWVTVSENAKHAFRIGLACNKGENHSRASITNKQAAEIKIMLAKGFSTKDIQKALPVSSGTISKIRTGARWGHIKV